MISNNVSLMFTYIEGVIIKCSNIVCSQLIVNDLKHCSECTSLILFVKMTKILRSDRPKRTAEIIIVIAHESSPRHILPNYSHQMTLHSWQLPKSSTHIVSTARTTSSLLSDSTLYTYLQRLRLFHFLCFLLSIS